MTFEEFLSELKSELRKYDMAGQIDELSIYKYYVEALRSFGLNIAERSEAILKVRNGKIFLPDDFNTLKTAYKCEPKDYYIESGYPKKNFNSPLWQERKGFFDESEDAFFEDRNCVKEKITFGDTPVNFRYTNLIPLKLSKNSNKSRYAVDCDNIHTQSPYSITLMGNEAKFSFIDGYVFLKYYSLPSDEDGKLIIPEIGNRVLNRYVEIYVKKRFFETLLYNDPEPNLAGLLQHLSNELVLITEKAKSDVRWSQINVDTFKKLQEMEIKRKKRYEITFPTRF